ncbi:MAG: DUF488 family protein, N3 subclade [Fusobacteriaceae bacterium]
MYCGQGSPLGNKYAFACMNHSARESACNMYQLYFDQQIKLIDSPVSIAVRDIITLLESGNDVNLQCFCKPNKRCHCETIKNHIDSLKLEPRDIIL